MKRAVIIAFFLIFFSVFAISDDQPGNPDDINLGRVYFPRPFVHQEKDFNRGVYRVILTTKEGVPYFKVSDKKGEYLFDEMAVVESNNSKNKKFRYRVKKEMLRGYEYFRIKVIKPDKLIMGYFLIKKKTKPPATEKSK